MVVRRVRRSHHAHTAEQLAVFARAGDVRSRGREGRTGL
jgi:hypothetical protein